MRNRIALLLAIAALVMGGLAGWRFFKENTAGSEYSGVREEVLMNVEAAEHDGDKGAAEDAETTAELSAVSEEEDSESTVQPSEEPTPSPTVKPLPEEVLSINWDKLKETCPDAYAWIRIDGTDIDYPIVQHETDNAWYLTHSAEGDENIAGAVFTENYNMKDFSNFMTVIYGHNMKNGSMFKGLHKYKDPVFFQEHPDIKIILPDKLLDVRVFAAYTSDNRHLLLSYDFTDKAIREAYLNDILIKKEMGSIIDTSVKVTADDRIVTLSVCNGNETQRYLVQGVIKEDS